MTAGGKRTAELSGDLEIVVTRSYDASREMVWKAWTDPAHFGRWWGPHGFTNPVTEVELRPGGAWRVVMRSPEGQEYPLRGTYLEIAEPERLVMTVDTSEHPAEWHELLNEYRRAPKGSRAGELRFTVSLAEGEGRTTLTVKVSFPALADRDAHIAMGAKEGWSQSFEKLEALLREG